jgi:hypothetical protein
MALPRPELFEGMGDDFTQAFGAPVFISGLFGTRRVAAVFREFRVNDALTGDYAGIETPAYVFSGRGCDLEGMEEEDLVVIDGKNLQVISTTDDGRAMRKLFLKDA